MIRLGVRLALRGGRSGIVRVALIAIALGAGITTLIVATWTISASSARSDYVLSDAFGGLNLLVQEQQGLPPGGNKPYLLWSTSSIAIRGSHTIVAYGAAPSGPGAPPPPGARRVPAPGTMLVSPHLRELLARPEGAALRRALPSHIVGTLGNDLVHDPRQLVVLRGYDLPTLQRLDPSASPIESFATVRNRSAEYVVLSVTTLGVLLFLLPLLVFIGAAARLGARRREQRLAVMRLVGATPAQARTLAAIEIATAGVIGMALGVTGALAIRAWLVSRGSYFPNELSTSPLRLAVLALAVAVVAAVSAPFALRRIGLSPLGIERQARRRSLSAWRWWLLVLGWASFALGGLFDLAGAGKARGVFLTIGVVAVALGLIGAGAWLVQRLARTIQARAARPSALLASRRLAADPRAGFRPMAVLVVTVFATSLLIVLIPAGQRSVRTASRSNGPAVTTVYPDLVMGSAFAPRPTRLDTTARQMAPVRGVQLVVKIQDFRIDDSATELRAGVPSSAFDGRGVALTDCATLAALLRTSARGCRPGVLVAPSTGVRTGGRLSLIDDTASFLQSIQPLSGPNAGPTPTIPPAAPPAPAATVIAAGRLGLLDRAGLVALVPPELAPPALRDARLTSQLWLRTDRSHSSAAALQVAVLRGAPGIDVRSGRSLVPRRIGWRGYRWFLYGILGFVLLLAACSLAVTVVDQIFDRRRSLATLRALGTPLATLRRATMIEIAAPLALATVLGAVNGTVMGLLFVVGSENHVVAPWLDIALFPALIAAGWLVVTAIGLAALGRAAPPVPARAG